jgi:GWxTD domain-containing protein
VALALLAATVAAGAAWSGAPPDLGPLPWRVGGRIGFTVDAAGFPDTTGYRFEVYVRIPPATLASLTRDSIGAGLLKLEVKVGGSFGARQNSANQEISITRQDTLAGFGKVVLFRFPAKPGPQRLQVKLADLQSRKHGLFYMGRQVTESGSIDGTVTFPAPQAGRDLSDIEFAWSVDSSRSEAAFDRAGHRIVPNPERLYGLYADQLKAFFVARSTKSDVRAWHTHARIADAAGHLVAESETTFAAAARVEGSFTFDLTQTPAGGYDLEVKAGQEGDPGALTRHARFSVAWLAPAWFRNPRDVEDEVHFLLSGAEDEEKFVKMGAGEQEQYLSEFWRVRDPDPGTAENEARNTFFRRVEYANRNFEHPGAGRGMFSDMGRVYIRYGEPSEILRQVIPSGDNTLRQIINELEVTEDRPISEVQQRGLGGDIRPFEVWLYEGQIAPPFDADPRVTPRMHTKRVVFLFVDEHGLGDYRLRYSSE